MVARLSTFLRDLHQWRRVHLQVDRHAVLEHVSEAGRLGPRFAFMVVMSCGIATLGLLQGSAAVIIGAMLISPLMGPIVELGMSLAVFDQRNLRHALRTIVVGVALSLAIAIAIVAVSPLQEPTSEILARTEPTLFDLLVAVFSGLAGAYATITRKGETIVGVAIATALMPPLAVVGFGIATGNGGVAGGAAFLFMTNLLAIALSVTVMARWYRFGSGDSPRQTAWQAALVLGTFALLSIPLGIALRDIAARGLAERSVRNSLEAAARESGGQITTVRVERRDRRLQVEAVLLTPRHRPGLAGTLEQRLEDAIGQPVAVQLREVLTADDAALAREQATLAQLRESVERLRSAADRDAQARSERDLALVLLRQRVQEHLGSLEVTADGQRAIWRLDPGSGLDLGAARALEAAVNGAALPGSPRVVAVPPLRALPPIAFSDDSAELDADARRALADIAWALQRWRAGAVRLRTSGGDTPLARARIAAVAAWLRGQGLGVAGMEIADRAASRVLAREQGIASVRQVRVEVAGR